MGTEKLNRIPSDLLRNNEAAQRELADNDQYAQDQKLYDADAAEAEERIRLRKLKRQQEKRNKREILVRLRNQGWKLDERKWLAQLEKEVPSAIQEIALVLESSPDTATHLVWHSTIVGIHDRVRVYLENENKASELIGWPIMLFVGFCERRIPQPHQEQVTVAQQERFQMVLEGKELPEFRFLLDNTKKSSDSQYRDRCLIRINNKTHYSSNGKVLCSTVSTIVIPLTLPQFKALGRLPFEQLQTYDLSRLEKRSKLNDSNNLKKMSQEIESVVTKLEQQARTELPPEGIALLVSRLTASTGQQIQVALQTPSPQNQTAQRILKTSTSVSTLEQQGNVRVRADGTRTIRGENILDVAMKIEKMTAFFEAKGVDRLTLQGVLQTGDFTVENRGWWKCTNSNCRRKCKEGIPSHPPSQVIKFTPVNQKSRTLKVPKIHQFKF